MGVTAATGRNLSAYEGILVSFTSPITEIIRERYSCRSYLEQPIEEETRLLLVDLMSSTTTGPFGNRARFELVAATEQDRESLRGLGTYGFIKGATGFVVGAVAKADKDLEDFGYLMESIVLSATDLGLGTCWLGGSFTRSSFAEKISLSRAESLPAVIAVGIVAPKPRRVDSIMRLGIRADRRLPWSHLFFDGGFGVPLSREASGEYAVPLEMVRLGPSASNRQPWRIVRDVDSGQPGWHFYLHRSTRYGGGVIGGLLGNADLPRVDIGIAMCHFDLAAGELGLKGRWVVKEPQIDKPDTSIEYIASWVGADSGR
jgi:nitroreductase